MIQPSCVSLTELDLCHQPAFPNIFYHTMQSYVLQAFEIVATTGVERRHSNRSSPAGLEHAKKRGGIHRISPLFHILLRARDVAERPGDVRLRRPEWNVDIRTVRPRQGSNIEKRVIQWMTLFSISLRARDVAERPGDVRLRRPEQRGDIRTVRARQGLNIEKRAIHRMTLSSISLRARDGIRTRDPRLGKAILHH